LFLLLASVYYQLSRNQPVFTHFSHHLSYFRFNFRSIFIKYVLYFSQWSRNEKYQVPQTVKASQFTNSTLRKKAQNIN